MPCEEISIRLPEHLLIIVFLWLGFDFSFLLCLNLLRRNKANTSVPAAIPAKARIHFACHSALDAESS